MLYRGMDRAQLDAAYNSSAAMPVRDGIAISVFYDLGCGSRWTGDEICWRHRPRHYAAIHFHEDDLYDCGWDTDFEVTVPDAIVSGVYGVRLRGGGEQDIVPIYVLPPAAT